MKLTDQGQLFCRIRAEWLDTPCNINKTKTLLPLVVTLAFCFISIVVYNHGQVAWVLPLRVVAIIGVAGYLAFAMASKTRYQPKPPGKQLMKRYVFSRIIVLVIVLSVAIGFLLQQT